LSNNFVLASASQAGISDFSEDKIIADIAAAKKLADVVIVSYHFGEEYKDTATTRQVDLAHLAIDNGASLVIGHHPHVVQNSEKYKDAYIVYSLGNFVFDQSFSPETMEGKLLKVVFKDKAIDKVEELPIKISNLYQASLAE
jgi:poly-gamma-glutamate synthesis protein (capsule biosynthesis protein)